jgi:hypothetical protein
MKRTSSIIVDSLHNRETAIFRRELLPHLRWFPASSLDVRQADDLAPNTNAARSCVLPNRLRSRGPKPVAHVPGIALVNIFTGYHYRSKINLPV